MVSKKNKDELKQLIYRVLEAQKPVTIAMTLNVKAECLKADYEARVAELDFFIKHNI